MKQPAVYILFNQRNGTLYVGVTSDLVQRVWQHKEGLIKGFSQKYGIKSLGYFECFEEMLPAIEREKQLKAGSRKKKIELIESMNPDWLDLFSEIIE